LHAMQALSQLSYRPMKQSLNSPLTLRVRRRLVNQSSAEKLAGEFSLMYSPGYP
jgi:hypothetical protein